MARGIGNYTRSKLEQIINDLQTEGSGDIAGVTAGSGLTGGGTSGTVTVSVDYAGSDSVIKSATDGTGITVATSDKLLIADNDDSDNVKYINISQLPTSVGGSDTQIQYNNGGAHAGAAQLSYVASSGYLGIGTTGANITHALTLPNSADAAGRIKANAFLTYSSSRYKKDVKTIQKPLELISNIRGVSFTWKKNKIKDFGFIAEEVGKKLPNIVDWEVKNKIAYSMDYTRIIPILVEGIKKQQNQIDALILEIISLKALTESK